MDIVAKNSELRSSVQGAKLYFDLLKVYEETSSSTSSTSSSAFVGML